MTFPKTLIALGVAAALAGPVKAEVTPEEAAQIGTTLTWIGAEQAGNADGSIPPYTGGLTTPPAGYDPKQPGLRPDPFADEKPLFSVDAGNMAQYEDKLTEGTKALMKKFPSFRIDVYPTHRTAAVPQYVRDNTAKNALECKTTHGGEGVDGCFGGIPFPIPKDGYQAMWNHLLRFGGFSYYVTQRSYYVDSAGSKVMTGQNEIYQEYPYYDPNKTSADKYWMLAYTATAPARLVGEQTLMIDPLNWAKDNRRAWQYLPGQRRVKLAPEIAYDTPNSQSAGANTYDDTAVFSGKMDRFDFKLVGKKEVFIPYNLYKFSDPKQCPDEVLVTPNHLNPDCVRWELHRVWVIEATLKPGKRHVYSKRVFYWDEDSYSAGASDQYDASGKLYRIGFAYMTPRYEVPAPTADVYGHYDLANGIYVINSIGAETGGYYDVPPNPSRWWTPEAMAGRGVR
ncbi:DUF1329 domain-containing protein [Thauera sp. Sel9]|uniref:DUF1329 domain-containing protein n=1 Tax=Thauera sp. Sel9 TaxID=2974299 RepID=UPI0021E1748C|nr:DUF1329 domain-containing protein [Thauera sp. Sel9]MCV2219134.1 DUF1329 domain-containing protein [Thauera sp. Sel9]